MKEKTQDIICGIISLLISISLFIFIVLVLVALLTW
jgi:hypothetical protein